MKKKSPRRKAHLITRGGGREGGKIIVVREPIVWAGDKNGPGVLCVKASSRPFLRV